MFFQLFGVSLFHSCDRLLLHTVSLGTDQSCTKDSLGPSKPGDITKVIWHEPGYFKEYEDGVITWSPKTCAHEIHGPVWKVWTTNKGFFGFADTDTIRASDGGLFNYFREFGGDGSGKAIFWKTTTGAHYVYPKGTLTKWEELGRERGFLGYPITNSTTEHGWGSITRFEGGYIFAHYSNVNELHDPIYLKWHGMGGPESVLHKPTLDTRTTRDGGLFNYFQGDSGISYGQGNGAIYYNSRVGAHYLIGEILYKWEGMGWQNSCLGYPTSDPISRPADGIIALSHFERGDITWYTISGEAHATCGDPCPDGQERDPSTGWCGPTPPPISCNGGNLRSDGRCEGKSAVSLTKMVPFQGFIPYVGVFPSIGIINDGILEGISNPNPFTISLIKAGNSSDECGDSEAVIRLGSGADTADMQSLYNSARPNLPVGITSCISIAGTAPQSILVDVTYSYGPRR